MEELSGIPFARLRFDKGGVAHNAPPELAPAGTTDVIVLAHGWKNDEADAEELYGAILGHARAAAGDAFDSSRTWSAVGVHWPAFRFRPDLTLLPDDGSPATGGAAGLEGDDLSRGELRAFATAVAGELGAPDPDRLADGATAAAGGGGPADAFADALRSLLSTGADVDADSEHEGLLREPGREIVARSRAGGEVDAAARGGTEAGRAGAGGASSFVSVGRTFARLRTGGAAAVARLLNQATYFEMKARAGVVGRGLARSLADGLPEGARLHLVGHSFGGRLVTAAAADAAVPPIESMSLLQAAYSHNGLGTDFGPGRLAVGGFRAIIDGRKVAGVIAVTHTLRDRAVGLFYAIASAAVGTIANSVDLSWLIGGPDDPHGGMGANGARSMRAGEAADLAASPGAPPRLRRGLVNNVLADAIVADHNDVKNVDVGALVWAAMSAGE